MNLVKLFCRILRDLLPLRNPTGVRNTAVEAYCFDYLRGINRTPVVDQHGNILSLVGPYATVAHTDSVIQSFGDDREAYIWDRGTVRSRNRKRPIGADDKVGLAVSLTLATTHPEFSCLLFADEEAGGVGSSKVVLPFQLELAVQCDRRGANDLASTIYGRWLTSEAGEEYLLKRAPHREIVDGGLTDVLMLSERGLARHACNLSCGYYLPHSPEEYIVLTHAYQALLDAESILTGFPSGVPTAEEELGWETEYTDWETEYTDWETTGEFDPRNEDWEEDLGGDWHNRKTGKSVSWSDARTMQERAIVSSSGPIRLSGDGSARKQRKRL